VKGWIGLVEAVSRDWAGRRRPDRSVLVELLTAELEHMLRTWRSA
jgi:hypothetical protein